VVKARDGVELKVALAENPQIASGVKASLSDIKQGSFVGVTAMPRLRAARAHSKYAFFLRQCAEKEKDTIHAIFDSRARSPFCPSTAVAIQDAQARAGQTGGVGEC
jgi:hypothetical protein